MKTRLFLGAALIAVAAALAVAVWPSPEPASPEPPPPAAQAQTEPIALRHRLADRGWRLVETRERGEDRRVEQRTSLLGGSGVETPSWFVLVRAANPISPETRRQFPDRDFTGAEERGECGGALYAGGFVVTAAHCVVDRAGASPLRLEICVQPRGRSTCRASFIVHRAAIDLAFEPDGAAGYREDRAFLRLPEDPGGGADLPQTLRAEIEPGERVHIFAMGSDAVGTLAERVSRCSQPVTDVRWGLVETRGEVCRIRRADSGSPAGRELPTGEIVPILIVSSYDPDDESRNFFAPLRPDKIRAALAAWGGQNAN